jgi:acylphosphatase
MPARRWLIRGVVQGVGFRHATRREALRLGLRGWVRNRGDGTVEVVAVGDATRLDALERWARHGPPAARVEQVEAAAMPDDAVEQLDPPVAEGFKQVRTAWS